MVFNDPDGQQAAEASVHYGGNQEGGRKPARLLRLRKERDHAGRTHAGMNSLSDNSRMLLVLTVRLVVFPPMDGLSMAELGIGCIFQANFSPSKSLRNCAVRFERVYAATQGGPVVYMRSHLRSDFRSKSLIQRKRA